AHGVAGPSAARGAVWVFSGHGSQWTGMGRGLSAEPVFASVVDELAPIFAEEAGVDLRAELAEADLTGAPADRVQPLIHVVQVALAQVLLARGARPAAVVGHSMGEIAAAVVAGALDRGDGARLILRRSGLLADATGQGSMVAVEMSADEAARRFRDEDVDVAVHSTGASVVLSGAPDRVDAVLKLCAADGTPARRVASDVAFHGRQMERPAALLARAVAELTPGQPRIAVYGTVHEDPRQVPAYDGEYWAANLRGPVRFGGAIGAALDDGHRLFLEVAPHAVVGRAIARVAEERGHEKVAAVATLRRDGDAAADVLLATAALHCAGAPVDLTALVAGGRLTDLPTYAWQHRRHGRAPHAPAPRRISATPAGEPGLPEEWMHDLVWRPAPAAAAATSTADLTGRHWLLLGDDDEGIAAAVAEQLDALGCRTTRVGAPEVARAADDAVAALLAGADRVVDLGAVARSAGLESDPAAVHHDVYRVLRVARLLARSKATSVLHVATRLAQATDDATEVRPGGAALWGLGAALALDYPHVWGGVVDLDVGGPEHGARGLVAELLRARPGESGHEPQVALRADERLVPRLVRAVMPRGTTRLDPDGCHLLVGASGLIGPRLAERLAAMGARHLVLVSRRGPAPELVERLRSVGVEVTAVAASVADAAAMGTLFARFGAELPPLHGVFHAALAGGYTETDRLGRTEVSEMLHPKVDGTALLHRLGLTQPLRHFVLFSSTTALLGARGLAHYAAANRFQDAFAHARRRQGLPAQVVNWGAWESWYTTSSYADLMRESGMRGLDDDTAIRILDRVLHGGRAQHVVANADWAELAGAYRSRALVPLLDELAPLVRAQDAGEVGARITAAAPARQRKLLRDHVRATVAHVMGFAEPAQLPTDERFFHLGMDSLMSLQAQRRLADDLGCELAPAVMFNHPTVDGLTDRLLPLLSAPDKATGPIEVTPASADGPAHEGGNSGPAGADANADGLTEEELVRRLTEKMRSLS
ncbi:SDR family NAD(P)-dependent oxidoreductase, partial [Streptomyces sp. SID3343]|uniref:SDR family NAD(P)-dependent oxidoreductase n=1 Tax=Streptomyces sp. SID3343 TaxID=2690260 RepID=UPI00136D1C0E